MEPQFQTSFIPKAPLNEARPVAKSSVSILTFIATIVFISSIVAGAGVYFYKAYLAKKVTESERSLVAAKDAFDPLLIQELQTVDKRLLAANEVMNKHLAITPLFDALEAFTLKKVRFTKFIYTSGGEAGNSGKLEVKLSGTAVDYATIALQSDIFNKDAYKKYIKEVLFSNLALTDKGSVNFDLSFTVDPTLLSYQEFNRRMNGQ